MSRFFNRKSIALALVVLALVAGFFGTVVLRGSATKSHAVAPKARAGHFAGAQNNPICQKLGKTIQASSGAQMICFGPQPNGPANAKHKPPKKNNFGANVDAANPAEDVAPNGTQAYGQSEESVAATSSYVVEAWNDATGFFSPPCSPMFKDQLTGFAFSNNGGKSFTDLGGLPNNMCASSSYSGDPSVETWIPGGTAYFYISSLFFDSSNFSTKVAMDACMVSGTGSSAVLSCNATPIIIANGGFFGFLDKDFLSIDPVRGLLYASYLDLSTGNIDLAVCDLGGPTGAGPGPLGGSAATPVCAPGDAGPAYIVVSTPTGCAEDEGAYPAVDLSTGDVYVAYEHNWATNLFGCNQPVQERVNQIPAPCITFPTSPCGPPFTLASIDIVSMDGAFIPGYNRFPMNDFPRIAVSDPAGTVSIVWNDARFHPAGDILLQSFASNGLFPATIQSAPVVVNKSQGGWHMLPALRNVDDDGDLQVTFYQRASANTDVTDVYAAIDLSPLATATPGNVKVTTGSSAWFDVSSDIIPNFGDYTDNYVIATGSAPFTQQTLSVAWADGRLGDPQPFYASAHTN